MKAVIITDSRGYGLEEHIKNKSALGDYEYRVISRGGCTLDQTRDIIAQQEAPVNGEKPNNFYFIFAGICSLTDKDQNTGKISYPFENIDNALEKIDLLYDQYSGRITLATITPADIDKHNNDEYIHTETQEIVKRNAQIRLEKDIEIINERILELNKDTLVISIQTHKHTGAFKKRNKRFTFNPETLYDGVHIVNKIKEKQFEHICKTIKNQLEYLEYYQIKFKQTDTAQAPQEDSDNPLDWLCSSQSSEEDTGNFKRYKRN